MKTKKQLQEELRQIAERELNELIEKHYPEFKTLESSENILSHFHGWSFQTDKYGNISIDFDYNNYVHSMSEENEISNEEFKTAWRQLRTKLSTADV